MRNTLNIDNEISLLVDFIFARKSALKQQAEDNLFDDVCTYGLSRDCFIDLRLTLKRGGHSMPFSFYLFHLKIQANTSRKYNFLSFLSINYD